MSSRGAEVHDRARMTASTLPPVPIPYGRQLIDEDDVQAVTDVLRSDWLTQGPEVAEFERAVAEACDVPYAVAFSSGTAALHAAAFAAGLGPGDELLTSSLTFAASANCGAYVGATPRFADIDPSTWNVSPETVTAAITPKTKAVVPVHYAGLPLPMKDLRAAVGDDVRLIEDAAHALGAETPDEPVGSCRYSDMCAFSFHPVKAIAAGEGGMVTTRDRLLRDLMVDFRNHGNTKDPDVLTQELGGWYYEQHLLGFNYRLSDIHSALGRSQLTKLGHFIARRNEVASRYRELLVDVPELELPPAARPGCRHAYHLFVVRHRGGAAERRRLYDELQGRGIRCQVHYLPVNLHPYYRKTFGYGPGMCPEAERYYEGCLSLPCYPALTEQEQDSVVISIKETLSG